MRLKQWLKRLLILLCIVAVLLIISVCTLLLAYQSGYLARVVKSHFGKTVQFTIVKQSWHKFRPEIVLKNLVLLSPTSDKAVLNVKSARFTVNILKSIQHRDLVTDQLLLSGLHVHLDKDDNAKFHLRGWRVNAATQISLMGAWRWITWQKYLLIDHVHVLIERNLQSTIELRNSRLLWFSPHGKQYHLVLNISLPALESGHFRLKATVENPDTFLVKPRAQFKLSASASNFGPLLSMFKLPSLNISKAKGHIEATGRIVGQHVTSLKVNLALHHLVFSVLSSKYPTFSGSFGMLNFDTQLIKKKKATAFTSKIDGLKVFKSNVFSSDVPLASLLLQGSLLQLNRGYALGFSSFKVSSGNLALNFKGAITEGVTWLKSYLKLSGSISGKNVGSNDLKWIPKTGLSPELRAWLKHNIRSVGLISGKFNVNGLLNRFPYHRGPGIFTSDISIKDAALTPYKAWPEIKHADGHLYFHKAAFKTVVSKGESMGVQIHRATVLVPNLLPGVPSDLLIKLDVGMRGKFVSPYISQSPLISTLPLFKSLAVEKPLALSMALNFPLAQPGVKDSYMGSIHFNDNAVYASALPKLILNHLKGIVNFKGLSLSSKGLSGDLMGKPLRVEFDSPAIRLVGSINASWMKKHFDSPIFKKLSGVAPFSIAVSHIGQPNKSSLIFTSSLQGISSDLKAPLFKESKVVLPLTIAISNLNNKLMMLVSSLGRLFNLNLQVVVDHELVHFKRGTLTCRDAKAVGHDGKFIINCALPYLSVGDWLGLMLSHTQYQGLFSNIPVKANIQIAKLKLFGLYFKPFSISAMGAFGDAWHLKLNSNKLNGIVLLPKNTQKSPIIANLSSFNINIEKKGVSRIPKIDFSAMPRMDLSVKSLVVDDRKVGSVLLKTIPKPYGLAINDLEWHNPSIDLMMQGALRKKATGQIQIQGHAIGRNYGKALDQIGFKNYLNQTSGTIDFSLVWAGGLFKPLIQSLNGWVEFDLKNGVLLSVNPGVSRLLGLFSLQALSRRLSFNFNDLTEKGLAFNTLKGGYKLKNGIASTDKVSMNGPALALVLKGDIDLPNKKMDQTVVVMPHVGSGIAIAATLLGGPIVGIATFVADHVLSNTVLKNKGLKYQLVGSWEDPKFVESKSKRKEAR